LYLSVAKTEEIDAQAAEIISGGYVTIKNTTNQPITYSMNGVYTGNPGLSRKLI
jgi:hypothetical protein